MRLSDWSIQALSVLSSSKTSSLPTPTIVHYNVSIPPHNALKSTYLTAEKSYIHADFYFSYHLSFVPQPRPRAGRQNMDQGVYSDAKLDPEAHGVAA